MLFGLFLFFLAIASSAGVFNLINPSLDTKTLKCHSPIDRYYKYYSLSGISPKLLKNEEHFNLHIRPKKVKRSEQPKVVVWKANAIQDSDLQQYPMDPEGYIYSHIVIYQQGIVKPPTFRLNTDNGTEFKNYLVQDFFINDVGILMKLGFPGKHQQQCFAEKANQALMEPLTERMTAQEMKTGIISVKWSEDYPIVLEALRKKWKHDPLPIPEGLPKISEKDKLLLEGTRVQVMLFEPMSVLGQKLHGKFRTGDIRWDPKIRIIKKLMLTPGQPPTYLVDGPQGKLGISCCTYIRKQLQVVLDNENPPPDSVIRKKQYLVKWQHYSENESTWGPVNRFKEDAPNLVNEFLGASRA
nr:15710_t:CDS:2 [Entrophospora candida]